MWLAVSLCLGTRRYRMQKIGFLTVGSNGHEKETDVPG
jgi:hypothetical protein